jgi:uncharacterized protein (TIGR04255 family)
LRSQFRTEFQTDDFLAVITLVNKYPKEANSFFSIIDIDVIKAIPKEENSMETLIATLEQAHSKEKNIFFSLLKKEFLDTLNPQYK